MSEAQESHRALSLRDIAEDEVARERFRRRLDSYRDELKLLVSEMSGLLAVVNMNACEAAGMSQEKLRAALDRVPRERELACEVYADASVIALLVHTLLKDRARQGSQRCKDEFAAWEEELERSAWFDVHGVAYGSIADDAFAVGPLRQLGQLAARLLNDPDAPAFPLCSRYITADDLAPDPDDTLVPGSAEDPASNALPPAYADAVPGFAMGDIDQFESFMSYVAGPNPCAHDERRVLRRLLGSGSLVVELASGESVVLLPRGFCSRFDAAVEGPWCSRELHLVGEGEAAWLPQQVERLRVLDSFHAVPPRPLRYLTGTREAPAPDVDRPVRLNLSLHNIDVGAERLWYACPVDEHPALAITPAWALWRALQLEAEAPDWDASYARSLLRAVQLDREHDELIIPRDLLAWAGIDVGEQAFAVVGNGEVLELWPAEAWHRVEEESAFDLNALFGES
ncbi:hypothetical protein [Enorma massiliensis]|uniref:hypothetical protein n=1 Tax=Enorma massiliensis TaxID=1472761 RepID=UPI002E795690|nr:hypothetical protein [Enorma massiliensis]